jgi:hypothetical protein
MQLEVLDVVYNLCHSSFEARGKLAINPHAVDEMNLHNRIIYSSLGIWSVMAVDADARACFLKVRDITYMFLFPKYSAA